MREMDFWWFPMTHRSPLNPKWFLQNVPLMRQDVSLRKPVRYSVTLQLISLKSVWIGSWWFCVSYGKMYWYNFKILKMLQALGIAEPTLSSLAWKERCNGTWTAPPTVVNTTQRLQNLRDQMLQYNISAYIITSNDDHQVQRNNWHPKWLPIGRYITRTNGALLDFEWFSELAFK